MSARTALSLPSSFSTTITRVHRIGLNPALTQLSSFQSKRFRHFKAHRTIPVQLLTDIERLGPRGTIHHVAPGFMRNNLFPRAKARYLAQEGPLLLNPDPQSQAPQVDDEQLANSLAAISEITLERNARPKPYAPDTSESLLYYPMNMEMVAEHLRETFEIKHLHPPYAVLSLEGDGAGSRRRLSSTGLHTVQVKLRNGSVVPLQIRIRRKVYGHRSSEETNSPVQTEPQTQSQTRVI